MKPEGEDRQDKPEDHSKSEPDSVLPKNILDAGFLSPVQVSEVDGDLETRATATQDSAEERTEFLQYSDKEIRDEDGNSALGRLAPSRGMLTLEAAPDSQFGKAIIRCFAEGLLTRADDLQSLFLNEGALHDFLTSVAGICGRGSETTHPGPVEKELIGAEVSSILDSAFTETSEKYPYLQSDLYPLVTKLTEAFHEIERDEQGLQLLSNDCRRWSENRDRFLQTIDRVTDAVKLLVESAEIPEIEGCSEEDRKLLNGRVQGIRLVLKMILQLPEKAAEILSPCEPVPDADFRTTKYLHESMAAALKNVSYHNYGLVTATRQNAERSRNSFFSFLSKHYFVILDALEDGKRNSEDLRTGFPERYPTSNDAIDALFSLYEKLIDVLEESLSQFNIVPIMTERGAEADYYLHEPFDTEADPELSCGQVFGIIHKGYEFLERLHGERNHVIRRARVRVVKN